MFVFRNVNEGFHFKAYVFDMGVQGHDMLNVWTTQTLTFKLAIFKLLREKAAPF